MFNISLRRLYLVCNNRGVRNIRNGRRKIENISNPGMQQRLDVYREEGFQLKEEDAVEFIDESESDFYKIGESYNEHLNDTLVGKVDKRHQIIKEKYFKENMPNLLTWSEKEQIRHLANTHPDEWSPERIAESFPVTVQVAKKLLKYVWKPNSEERIARHDASAMRNWRELREGSLDIPEDLRQHFLKFSERTIPPLNKQSIKLDITPEKMGEFESIIHRCAPKDGKQNETKSTSLSIKNDVESTKKIKDYKLVTLEQLTDRVKAKIDSGNDVKMPDKIMFDTIESSKNEIISTRNIDGDIEPLDDSIKQVSQFKPKSDEVASVKPYPERIRIPKKAYKRGATYKVNDCYYDHDGRFLYRVLGMSS